MTEKCGRVIVPVNLGPFAAHAARLKLPLETPGIGEDEQYVVEGSIPGRHFRVRPVPNESVAEMFRLGKADT